MDTTRFDDPREWRKFALGLAAILAALATLQLVLGRGLYPWFYAAAGAAVLAGLLRPRAVRPLYVAFSYLGAVLGWLSTRIILSVLFYALFTPLGLCFRLLRRGRLDTRFPGGRASYWIERPAGERNRVDYEKQF